MRALAAHRSQRKASETVYAAVAGLTHTGAVTAGVSSQQNLLDRLCFAGTGMAGDEEVTKLEHVQKGHLAERDRTLYRRVTAAAEC